jgi:hypothetical protein
MKYPYHMEARDDMGKKDIQRKTTYHMEKNVRTTRTREITILVRRDGIVLMMICAPLKV